MPLGSEQEGKRHGANWLSARAASTSSLSPFWSACRPAFGSGEPLPPYNGSRFPAVRASPSVLAFAVSTRTPAQVA